MNKFGIPLPPAEACPIIEEGLPKMVTAYNSDKQVQIHFNNTQTMLNAHAQYCSAITGDCLIRAKGKCRDAHPNSTQDGQGNRIFAYANVIDNEHLAEQYPRVIIDPNIS